MGVQKGTPGPQTKQIKGLLTPRSKTHTYTLSLWSVVLLIHLDCFGVSRFGDSGHRDVCLLSSIMELDVTWFVEGEKKEGGEEEEEEKKK